MKLVLCLVLLWSTYVMAQDDSLATEKDSLVSRLSQIELENYLNKFTDSILQELPPHFDHEFQTSTIGLYKYMVVLTYKDRPYLKVHLFYDALRNTNPNQISKRRRLKSLRKEVVKAIHIYDASLCLNGCDR